MIKTLHYRQTRMLLYVAFALAMACAAMLATISTALAQESQAQQCIVTVRVLNIRPVAGTSQQATGSFQQGDSFVLLEKNADGSWGRHATGWSYLPSTSCGGGSAIAGGQGSNNWCYATSPTYEGVAVATAPKFPRVHEFNNVQRAYELDWHWRNSGPWSWIKASGGQWSGSLCQESRQPDERIYELQAGLGNTLVVKGLELRGSMHVNWPACISTDQPVILDADDGGKVQPDKKNPAVVCTECSVSATTFSFWSDCGEWHELWPENRQQ